VRDFYELSRCTQQFYAKIWIFRFSTFQFLQLKSQLGLKFDWLSIFRCQLLNNKCCYSENVCIILNNNEFDTLTLSYLMSGMEEHESSG